jgi:hypothetical protein
MSRVIMTLLVRDNADIVAENMDFHLAMGVDHILVTNNRSEDATRDIVLDYVRRGAATLIDEFDDDYDQSAWVTRMARMAARDLSADWVINSDVDEFWWPLDGNLKAVFASAPTDCDVLFAPRLNFLPMHALAAAFWREMVWRYVVSRNALGEPLPGKVAHRAVADITVAEGNHTVTSAFLKSAQRLGRIEILHFPYRSYAQYAGKIAKGGAAVERNTKVDAGVFGTWRQQYALQRNGGLESWYRQLPHGDDPMREAMVSKGEIVMDTRLRKFMAKLGSGHS